MEWQICSDRNENFIVMEDKMGFGGGLFDNQTSNGRIYSESDESGDGCLTGPVGWIILIVIVLYIVIRIFS